MLYYDETALAPFNLAHPVFIQENYVCVREIAIIRTLIVLLCV